MSMFYVAASRVNMHEITSTGAIQDAFYTDDNTNARKVKPAEHSVVARNVYAIFLQRTD